MSKGGNKDVPVILFFCVVLFFIWVGGSIYQMNKLSLPENVDTLQIFVEQMPTPKEVHIFENNNRKYIEVIGHLPNFPATPSGHPIYIFDDKGKIVYWTRDSGDSNYWDDWGRHRKNTEDISSQEALELVKEK